MVRIDRAVSRGESRDLIFRGIDKVGVPRGRVIVETQATVAPHSFVQWTDVELALHTSHLLSTKRPEKRPQDDLILPSHAVVSA